MTKRAEVTLPIYRITFDILPYKELNDLKYEHLDGVIRQEQYKLIFKEVFGTNSLLQDTVKISHQKASIFFRAA